MHVHRKKLNAKLSFAVTKAGEWILAQTVWENSKINGGRMILTDGGTV